MELGNAYWKRLLGLFCGRNYQYRPHFHTETRRAGNLDKSCHIIRKLLEEIINYFDHQRHAEDEHRTTNNVVEGINNKLKLIKRRGYGLKNFRNFWVKSMLSWHFVC
jgi:hypothetical protein